MITAYAQRELRDADEVLARFERGRLGMIERTAQEFGLSPQREEDVDVEYLRIEVEIDFENDADPEVEDLVDRFTVFLYALEDRDIGHLLFEVETERERSFLEELDLAFVSVEPRAEDRCRTGRARAEKTEDHSPFVSRLIAALIWSNRDYFADVLSPTG
jgi:hypothetical protein